MKNYKMEDINSIDIENIDRYCCVVGANALRVTCFMQDDNEIKFKTGVHNFGPENQLFTDLAEDLYFEFYNKKEGKYTYNGIPVSLH